MIRLNIDKRTILKIKPTCIAIVKVDIDLHTCRRGTFRQREPVLETVLRIKSARPDANAGKVYAMITENVLELGARCRVCIFVNESRVFKLYQRTEVGTIVVQGSTPGPGREGKHKNKQGD